MTKTPADHGELVGRLRALADSYGDLTGTLDVVADLRAAADQIERMIEALENIDRIIQAFSDAAADPPLWAKLTSEPVSALVALELISDTTEYALQTGEEER